MSQNKILNKVTFSAGQTIFNKGEMAEDIFLVQDGKIELFKTDINGLESRIKILGSGYAFGEHALIMPKERPHSARAIANTLCVAVSRRKLIKQLDNEDPFIAALFKILQTNMRSVNQMGKRPKKDDLEAMTAALSLTESDE